MDTFTLIFSCRRHFQLVKLYSFLSTFDLYTLLICREPHVIRSLMESKLRSGTTLIVDRYSFSGVAFSSAKGLDAEWCKVENCVLFVKTIILLVKFATLTPAVDLQAPETGLLAPDLVIYLDISPEVHCFYCIFHHLWCYGMSSNVNRIWILYHGFILPFRKGPSRIVLLIKFTILSVMLWSDMICVMFVWMRLLFYPLGLLWMSSNRATVLAKTYNSGFDYTAFYLSLFPM